MVAFRTLKRLGALGWRDWLLLAEATHELGKASAAIRFQPFSKAIVRSTVEVSRIVSADPPERLVWAVRVTASRMPFRALCIEQGLALQAMMRRRGLPATLHYGMRREAPAKLEAHVWVTLGEEMLIGGQNAGDFVEVARVP